ncbi:MAG: adenylate kinase family enzyme [Phenylobacterium sp.]|jgi:adenylate kinase family enzyme
MRKILIFGNSGSGKSTLAKVLASSLQLAHLDLDPLAWLPMAPGKKTPPGRMPLSQSAEQIKTFTNANAQWVIEGCYTDLLDITSAEANEIIFLNLEPQDCISNAKERPWEPHKYDSKAAQDSNLPMLIDWINQYVHREDVCSRSAHLQFYQSFSGLKTMRTSNS